MRKTTINIEDAIMERLKEEAAHRHTTMTALIQAGILRILAEGEGTGTTANYLPPLPLYDMGEPLVDVADRNALYDVMDREQDERLYGVPQDGAGYQAPAPPRTRAVAEDVEAYDAGDHTHDQPDGA